MVWKSCARNVEDAAHNTTRFYVVAPRPAEVDPATPNLMTTFVFRVRNVPAALYKALGGFATNGVNMTKLESYMINGEFTATQFLCDVEGHPEQPGLRRALEELSFFSTEVRVLGVYPMAAFRLAQGDGELMDDDPGRAAGRLAQLILNRPAKLNAVDAEMLIAELLAAIDAAEADASCRAVVLTGAGRGFCAGQELGADCHAGPERAARSASAGGRYPS